MIPGLKGLIDNDNKATAENEQVKAQEFEFFLGQNLVHIYLPVREVNHMIVNDYTTTSSFLLKRQVF